MHKMKSISTKCTAINNSNLTEKCLVYPAIKTILVSEASMMQIRQKTNNVVASEFVVPFSLSFVFRYLQKLLLHVLLCMRVTEMCRKAHKAKEMPSKSKYYSQ